MENKFHSLPPLKRFRLMQQHEHHHQETHINTVSPPCLPAKKRKQPLCPPPSPPPPPFTPNSTTTTYCLPAKKRIWAFQPQTSNSPFDLNIEYNPLFDEEKDDISNQEAQKRVESEGEEEDDDGILCAVCKSTDGDPKDPIVFCDGCDLMVHTTCYGSPLTDGVPDGDWFCSKCLNKKDCFSCCLCPVTDGAMKSTNDNRWAHIVCALFVPEVFFCDPDGREGIDCSKVPAWRWEKSCYVCGGGKGKGNGCVIDCSEPKCRLSFHVTCGLKEELCIEYREGRKKGVIVAGFCKSHTDLWDKQQQTGKFKIVARAEHRN